MPYLPIVSELIELGTTYIKGKQEIKKTTTEAQAEVIRKSAANVEEWERLQAQGSQTSWKDEYLTLVLTIPAICAFVPFMVPYVQEGFVVLKEMPEYYKMYLGVCIASSFGIRAAASYFKRS